MVRSLYTHRYKEAVAHLVALTRSRHSVVGPDSTHVTADDDSIASRDHSHGRTEDVGADVVVPRPDIHADHADVAACLEGNAHHSTVEPDAHASVSGSSLGQMSACVAHLRLRTHPAMEGVRQFFIRGQGSADEASYVPGLDYDIGEEGTRCVERGLLQFIKHVRF